MKTPSQALVQAEELEHQLSVLTSKIACNMQKPASKRDFDQLTEVWTETATLRSQVVATGRFLRKIKKPVRNQLTRSEFAAQRDMYKQAQAFLRRQRQWGEIERIVHLHLNPTIKPLLSEPSWAGQEALLLQLYAAFHSLANPIDQDPKAHSHGCFSDIALPIRSFEMLMSAAYRVCLAQNPQRMLRFLDVGCGGGTKVFVATRYFRQADGLEYDQGYADSACRTLQIVGASNSIIHCADAMTFENYSDYDVIYFYRPLRTDELLEKMEQQIMKQARIGTILVAPYDSSLNTREGLDCAQVEGPIFVTGIDQTEADQLRLDAQATGTEILSRSMDRKFDTGHWAPILDAASFSGNGFEK